MFSELYQSTAFSSDQSDQNYQCGGLQSWTKIYWTYSISEGVPGLRSKIASIHGDSCAYLIQPEQVCVIMAG